MADEPIRVIKTPIHLEFDHSAGVAATGFLRGLEQGKLFGARSGPGEPVMIPPRGADPRTASSRASWSR